MRDKFAFPTGCVPKNESDKIIWLRLIRSENVGPVTFIQLLKQYGNVKDALESLPHLTRKGGSSRKIKVFPKEEAEKEIEAGKKLGAELICIGEDRYPTYLANIYDPPAVLWLYGNESSLLCKSSVAIVGSRNASAVSKKFTFEISHELSDMGFSIVSGMARGIDASAHWGAIKNGTVAVLAGGVDSVYPNENKELYDNIVEKGLIVSEMPIGMQSMPRYFPKRNRIVSGICAGIIVVEATEKSGSLISAKYALDQGREVMAVPGHPMDPRSGGCNKIIQEGASLVRSAEDVRNVLSNISLFKGDDKNLSMFEEKNKKWMDDSPVPDTETPENIEIREKIFSLCNYTPIEIDEIIRTLKIPTRLALLLILELNLAGRITYVSEGTIALSVC